MNFCKCFLQLRLFCGLLLRRKRRSFYGAATGPHFNESPSFPVSTVATNVTDKPIPLSLRLDDPKDVTAAKGQPATFLCRARTNSTQLHFKWYFNDSLIAPDDARRKQLANGTLYIPKVAGKRLEGLYRCLATNEFGSLLSNPATLRIAGGYTWLEHL